LSALSSPEVFGRWYRLDIMGISGFVPTAEAQDADNILCVTGPIDTESLTTQMLNVAATIPTGSTRWTVDGTALKAAFDAGQTIALTPA
jgi:hypothetical protein